MDPKYYFLREELPIAEELLALAPNLLKEFLDYHTDFIEGDYAKGKPYRSAAYDTTTIQSSEYAWKYEGIKYSWEEKGIYSSRTETPEILDRFPTAVALTKKYMSVCPVSTYSILEKNNVITRHVGLENIDGSTVRIHIPLFVPEGDIFLETEGVEIDWSDIYGFANQYVHSAHNYSDTRRLVYLIDIERKYIGLPPTEPFTREELIHRARNYPDFERGLRPKQLHSKQK